MEVVRPILFSAQFKNYHHLTPEQYLSGMSATRLNGKVFIHNSPEEAEDFFRENWGKEPRTSYREHYEKVISSPSDIQQAIAKYRNGPNEVGVGMNPLSVARDLRDLTTEMSTNSKPNDRTLYRGAERSPFVDAGNNQPISFSERKAAANEFARRNRGEVFQVAQGTVRGLRMEDYGVKPMTVGSRNVSEAEWLVDPLSFKTSR